MRFPLLRQHRSIFIGNLGLFWIYFYGRIKNGKRIVIAGRVGLAYGSLRNDGLLYYIHRAVCISNEDMPELLTLTLHASHPFAQVE